MSNRKTPILQTLPRISAIYYALLQTGYEYYPYERNAAHRAQVERFAGTGPQVPFFAAVRQNTCSVYPYWPRAAILEEASLYIEESGQRFVGFDAFRSRVLSASNIAPEEKGEDLWDWIAGFPEALQTILESDGFQRYLKWALTWAEEQSRGGEQALSLLKDFVQVCLDRYGARLPRITVALDPIKCVYSSDHYRQGDKLLFTSGALRPDSIVHECLHPIVHPLVEEGGLGGKQRAYPEIDESYYLDRSEAGFRNAFEEYAVRSLTRAVLRGDVPMDLAGYLAGLTT